MATPNGRIPKSQLIALPASWSNKGVVEYLRADAAASLSRALNRAVADSGANFQLFDAYRSLEEQEAMLKRNYTKTSHKGKSKSSDRVYQGVRWVKKAGRPNTATPGLSNHGTGTAIDIHHGGIQQWFKTRGAEYGWSWAEGKRNGEDWHFTYDPRNDQHKSEGWLDHAAVQRAVGAEADGKIGTGTIAKIKEWQTKHGLAADGKIGPDTKRKLLGAAAGEVVDEVADIVEAVPPAQVEPREEYVLERHQTKNLRPGRVDKKRGLTGELKVITIHYWGAKGQKFDNVVDWLVADGNGNNSTSAHEVIEGGRVAILADIEDGTWNSGSAQGNVDNYALELRPEADVQTIRTAAARIAAVRKESGKDLPLDKHNDYTSTSCPGPYADLLAELDALARGETIPTPEVSKPKPVPKIDRLKVDGRFGESTVIALQIFLNSRGADLDVDGKAGPATWSALQEYLGTPVDGKISHQSYRPEELGNGITGGWDYDGPGAKGSTAIRELQRWVGTEQDGILFEGTTKGLQRKLNTHSVGM